ncbi:MAG: hypothetical protein IKR81_09530, partial [Victivallales bacterium]|nr:hypothetical protein [Victivallales bacterium]
MRTLHNCPSCPYGSIMASAAAYLLFLAMNCGLLLWHLLLRKQLRLRHCRHALYLPKRSLQFTLKLLMHPLTLLLGNRWLLPRTNSLWGHTT